MASPESGEEPFGDEWQLRVDVHTAVERAFDRALDGVDREPTALELEKAALFVVWEFDLDLTRSWYIAGGTTAVGHTPEHGGGSGSVSPAGPTGPVDPTGPVGPTGSTDSGSSSGLTNSTEGSVGERRSDGHATDDGRGTDDSHATDDGRGTDDSHATDDGRGTNDGSVTFGDLHATVGDETRVERFADYLASETLFDDYTLRKVWFTDRFDFLDDFYRAHAPEEYRELYRAAAEIRRGLRDVRDTARNATDGTTLADFGAGSQPVLDRSTEQAFRDNVSRFHLELADCDPLSETLPVVTHGTDLIERTLFQLTQTMSVDDDRRARIEELSEFFFYSVWRYPALAISAETATGPNETTLRVERLEAFQTFDETVDRRRDRLAERLDEASLLPSAESAALQIRIERPRAV